MQKSQYQPENQSISNFILKLSTLLEDQRTHEIIHWSSKGDTVIIDGHSEFLEPVLAEYFNHTKISSFIRQLNLYGFRKVSQKGSKIVYQHPQFSKDNKTMLKFIKRKRKNIVSKIEDKGTQVEVRNPMMQQEKSKVKELQGMYFRIKRQNLKISKQTHQYKNHCQLLTQVKGSEFLKQLKFTNSQNLSNSVQGSQQHLNSSTNHSQITKSKSNKTETSANPFKQTFEQIHESFSPNKQNHQQNAFQNMFNNFNTGQMPMLQQHIEQLYHQKHPYSRNTQRNFWSEDEAPLNGSEFQ